MCQDCVILAILGFIQSSVSDFLKQIAFWSLGVQYHVSFILSLLPNGLQLAVASHPSFF